MRSKQIEQQKKIIEDLEANVLEVDSQLKRCTEKEARMKMYLDMNIVDATSQLTQFGKEKDDLEARLDQVENKLRGNRRKERLLTIHTQILRLQTNLECPICAETASSPIYQCREVTYIFILLSINNILYCRVTWCAPRVFTRSPDARCVGRTGRSM